MTTGRALHRELVAALGRIPAGFVLGLAFAAGVTWGIFARVWMRFITTHAEFSWFGTLFVVVGFGAAVVGQAGAYLARRHSVRFGSFVALRVTALVALLPLAFGAGGFAFPLLVLVPLAVVRERWSRWIRVGLAVLSVPVAVFISATFFAELSVVRAGIGTFWFGLVYAGLVWTVCFSLASRDDHRFGNPDPDVRP